MYFVRRFLQCLKPCAAIQRVTKKLSCTTVRWYSHQVTERELPQYVEYVISKFNTRAYLVLIIVTECIVI